jgi:hypothetical protein
MCDGHGYKCTYVSGIHTSTQAPLHLFGCEFSPHPSVLIVLSPCHTTHTHTHTHTRTHTHAHTQVGIKRPEGIAIPSVRNDAAFIATVFVVFSFTAILAGNVLPGDWCVCMCVRVCVCVCGACVCFFFPPFLGLARIVNKHRI